MYLHAFLQMDLLIPSWALQFPCGCVGECSAVGLVAEAGVGTAEPASHPPQESCQSNEAVAGSKPLQQGPSVPGRLVQHLLWLCHSVPHPD